MEQLIELKTWLMGFSLWGDGALTVDMTGAEPGDCALFPLGLEVLESRENLLGGKSARLRRSFLLRRTANRGEDAARWLLSFQLWVRENAHTAPVFGHRQVFRAEKGRLISAVQTGLGTYEVRLTAEYTTEV